MDLKEKFHILSYRFGAKEPIITVKIKIQSFLSWEMFIFTTSSSAPTTTPD